MSKISLLSKIVTLYLLLICSPIHANQILIGGTGAALGTIRHLASEYQKINPNIAIKVLPSLGSGGGIRALAKDKIDIALIGRKMKANERQLGLKQLNYVKTPLVFVIDSRSTINSITTHELQSYYNGKSFHWPNGERCRPIMRPMHDSETMALKKQLPELAAAIDKVLNTNGINITQTAQQNAEAINNIPGSFGYTTLALLLSENRPLKALNFNNIEPTISNLMEGIYPLYKNMELVIKPEKYKERDDFISFIFSEPGRRIIEKYGNHFVTK